jgi:hypothetical protein
MQWFPKKLRFVSQRCNLFPLKGEKGDEIPILKEDTIIHFSSIFLGYLPSFCYSDTESAD